MPRNIKSILLWEDNPAPTNKVPLVKLEFNFPCTWSVLHIDDLKTILREWIKGEERAYPQPQFKGRWMLFDEIKKVFDEDNGGRTL